VHGDEPGCKAIGDSRDRARLEIAPGALPASALAGAGDLLTHLRRPLGVLPLVGKVIVHKGLERDGTQLPDRLLPVLEDLPELVGRGLQRGVSQLRALGAVFDVIDEGVLIGLG
jgi:hypothetical protein